MKTARYFVSGFALSTDVSNTDFSSKMVLQFTFITLRLHFLVSVLKTSVLSNHRFVVSELWEKFHCLRFDVAVELLKKDWLNNKGSVLCELLTLARPGVHSNFAN